MQFLIDRIRQLINVSDDEEQILKELFVEKELVKGELFLKEDQVCRSLGLIHHGLIRYYINVDGEEKTYYFGAEGDFVCDYESFIPQLPSDKNIEALEDTSLYTVSHEGLQNLYDHIKEGDRFGRLGIEQVFINVIQQLSSFYNDPPLLRYQRFLETFPGISQRVPQYYIASYVGIKPQSLSRIRNRLMKNIN